MVLPYLVEKNAISARRGGRRKTGLNGRKWAGPAAPLANGTPMHCDPTTRNGTMVSRGKASHINCQFSILWHTLVSHVGVPLGGLVLVHGKQRNLIHVKRGINLHE